MEFDEGHGQGISCLGRAVFLAQPDIAWGCSVAQPNGQNSSINHIARSSVQRVAMDGFDMFDDKAGVHMPRGLDPVAYQEGT
jgi:hypothetical protein